MQIFSVYKCITHVSKDDVHFRWIFGWNNIWSGCWQGRKYIMLVLLNKCFYRVSTCKKKVRVNKGTISNWAVCLLHSVGLQSFSFYILSVSRCVKSMANVCVLTVAAVRVWRHPSPPPVRPPHQGRLAATQAHR